MIQVILPKTNSEHLLKIGRNTPKKGSFIHPSPFAVPIFGGQTIPTDEVITHDTSIHEIGIFTDPWMVVFYGIWR